MAGITSLTDLAQGLWGGKETLVKKGAELALGAKIGSYVIPSLAKAAVNIQALGLGADAITTLSNFAAGGYATAAGAVLGASATYYVGLPVLAASAAAYYCPSVGTPTLEGWGLWSGLKGAAMLGAGVAGQLLPEKVWQTASTVGSFVKECATPQFDRLKAWWNPPAPVVGVAPAESWITKVWKQIEPCIPQSVKKLAIYQTTPTIQAALLGAIPLAMGGVHFLMDGGSLLGSLGVGVATGLIGAGGAAVLNLLPKAPEPPELKQPVLVPAYLDPTTAEPLLNDRPKGVKSASDGAKLVYPTHVPSQMAFKDNNGAMGAVAQGLLSLGRKDLHTAIASRFDEEALFGYKNTHGYSVSFLTQMRDDPFLIRAQKGASDEERGAAADATKSKREALHGITKIFCTGPILTRQNFVDMYNHLKTLKEGGYPPQMFKTINNASGLLPADELLGLLHLYFTGLDTANPNNPLTQNLDQPHMDRVAEFFKCIGQSDPKQPELLEDVGRNTGRALYNSLALIRPQGTVVTLNYVQPITAQEADTVVQPVYGLSADFTKPVSSKTNGFVYVPKLWIVQKANSTHANAVVRSKSPKGSVEFYQCDSSQVNAGDKVKVIAKKDMDQEDSDIREHATYVVWEKVKKTILNRETDY